MKVAFVRIVKVEGLPATFSDHAHQVCVKILPVKEGSYGNLIGKTSLECDSTWTFAYSNARESSVCFSFFETEPERRELARLTLPFSWFELNTVVTEDYPCRMIIPELANNTAMATVQIHLSENGHLTAQAPPGRLLVKPAWKRPNSEGQPKTEPESETKPTPPQKPQQQKPPQMYQYQYPYYGVVPKQGQGYPQQVPWPQQQKMPYPQPYQSQYVPVYPYLCQYPYQQAPVPSPYQQPRTVPPQPQKVAPAPAPAPVKKKESPKMKDQPQPKPKQKPKKKEIEQGGSLGVPEIGAPDEDPIGAVGNDSLLEGSLKPLSIQCSKPSGVKDSSVNEPLIEDAGASMSGGFLPTYPNT